MQAKNLIALILTGVLMAPGVSLYASAEEKLSARDTAVDDALIKNAGWAGVLPPTRGEAAAGTQAPFVNPTFPLQAKLLPTLNTQDRSDKKAKAFLVKGDVKIAKKSGKDWKALENGMLVEEGDIILTAKNATASVTFDANYGNVSHLPGNTRAVFRSIEPTDIYLEDGTIYNFFDALPKNSHWKVSSPTAVAAVRGTQFFVSFTTASGEYFVGTFLVPDDGSDSEIQLTDVRQGTEDDVLNIPEDFQIHLKEGQPFDEALLEKMNAQWRQAIEEFLNELEKLRSQGSLLPSTSGEFYNPGTLDPGGADAISGDSNLELDPVLDTNAVTPDPEPSFDSDSSSGDYSEDFPDPQPSGSGPPRQ